MEPKGETSFRRVSSNKRGSRLPSQILQKGLKDEDEGGVDEVKEDVEDGGWDMFSPSLSLQPSLSLSLSHLVTFSGLLGSPVLFPVVEEDIFRWGIGMEKRDHNFGGRRIDVVEDESRTPKEEERKHRQTDTQTDRERERMTQRWKEKERKRGKKR